MTETEREKQEALKLVRALTLVGPAVTAGTALPFANYLNDTSKIKKQEAMRMFPQADPNMFGESYSIPLNQREASRLVFGKFIGNQSPLNVNNIYGGTQSFPEYLDSQPGAPSLELGSYAQAIGNKTIFPEGDIQAITVTPSPNPSRFAKDYAEILADKLGKTLNQKEQFLNQQLNDWEESYGQGINIENTIQANRQRINKLNTKSSVLANKTPGTAGYVWGNTKKPQYSYAEGNWGLGQKEAGSNPAIYLSRINADPSKEADYLFTGQILKNTDEIKIDPRARFKQYEGLGPGTGPSWGINSANEDISFRKDLIGARGELTVGDLQSLLAERNLPFAYQSYAKTPDRTITGSKRSGVIVRGDLKPTQRPGDVLRKNLQKLADAEGISTAQAIEKFARLVPNVGEPATPPTSAVTGKVGEFPVQGQAISPFGKFASKTDLRQIGILPPADKATYTINESPFVDHGFKHIYPRYGASTLEDVDTYSAPIDPSDIFANNLENKQNIVISRDVLRPQAANKLLNRTVANLVEQSKPIQGLGLGGLATGAVATAMDPAVIDALSRGDYTQAATTAAVNTGVGSAVGGATAKGLQALRAAGYARPAAAIGSVLPAAGGVLAGLGAVETGKALNRAYKAQTGKDFVTRNQPASPYSTYAGPTPTIKPRMGTAILGGKPVQVPYGSVAGERKVGRPWWDKAGTQFQRLLNSFSPMLGR